jgi:hypothetical protein
MKPKSLFAVFCLFALAGTVHAEAWTQPHLKNLRAEFCPAVETLRPDAHLTCSSAELTYPGYPETPWLDALIGDSVIRPGLLAILKPEKGETSGDAAAWYQRWLDTLVRENATQLFPDEEKPPLIQFVAEFSGPEVFGKGGDAGQDRFGSFLQFDWTHSLDHDGMAHPAPPESRFVVIDMKTRRILDLADILADGRERALETMQRKAFYEFLKTREMKPEEIEAHLNDPTFTFRLSRDWRIASGGLVFRYGMYEVGPRVFGMPEIFVPKRHLEGIVRPEILRAIPQ